MTEDKALYRRDFPWHMTLATRWSDNDQYGHVNNVTYYSYFDTAVNRHLIEVAGQDPQGGGPIGVVVETGCRFLRPVSFPDMIEVGIIIKKFSTSSVTYKLGIFVNGYDAPAAVGHFVHVYVDRKTFRSVPIPSVLREKLEKLHVVP